MTLCFFDGLGTSEMVILVLLGLLLFGGRLPEVGRSLGKNLAKLKKSMSEMAPEVEKARAQINEVSQGLRNAANEVTAEVRSQIDIGTTDPGSTTVQPVGSAAPPPTSVPIPGMPPEAVDPWLGTEVAPGCEPSTSASTPQIGPTGAAGLPRPATPTPAAGPGPIGPSGAAGGNAASIPANPPRAAT